MKQADLEKHFRCGPVEAAYENSKWFSGFMKVLFLLVAIYFFWLMTGEAHLVEHLDNWAVLAFCLWRIHRQDDVMCYVTRKGLIVRRQFRSLHEFYDDQFHEERSLIFLPYKDIFVISDNWQEIQLGEAEEGGLAVLPVHLQFLSKRNNSASSTASSRPMKRTMTKAPIDRTCPMCDMHESAWRHADFLYPKAFIFLTK